MREKIDPYGNKAQEAHIKQNNNKGGRGGRDNNTQRSEDPYSAPPNE